MIYLGAIGPIQLILICVVLIFPIIAIVDIVKSDFKGENDKLIWILIAIFLGLIGTLLYFIIGTKQKIQTKS